MNRHEARLADRIRSEIVRPTVTDIIVVRHKQGHFVEAMITSTSLSHQVIYNSKQLNNKYIRYERSIKKVGLTWWIRPIEEVIQLMTKKVPLECCVCGQDAGMFHQHHNRDTGYGICKSCVADEIKRSTPQSIKECYGIVGVNYAEQN